MEQESNINVNKINIGDDVIVKLKVGSLYGDLIEWKDSQGNSGFVRNDQVIEHHPKSVNITVGMRIVVGTAEATVLGVYNGWVWLVWESGVQGLYTDSNVRNWILWNLKNEER